MGLKVSKELRPNDVLNQVDEAQIFYAYFGPFRLKKVYPSVFREDAHPSTGFYINKAGKLIYNDIVTCEKLDCFAFVAKKFGLSYPEAVHRVACDFGIIPCEGVVPFKKFDIEKAMLAAEAYKKETSIEFIPDKWSGSYVKYWEQFGVTVPELEAQDVYPIRKLYLNGEIVPNYGRNIRFAYVIKLKRWEYKKIYCPYAEDKKFRWIANNIPSYIPFGINKLPFKSNKIIVTKAQKDRIILLKWFTDVIALQNESSAALRDKTIEYLNKRYTQKYINFDIDKAGMDGTEYYQGKGFEPFQIPHFLYEKHGIKDVADFVQKYGIKRFEDYLKHKQLI